MEQQTTHLQFSDQEKKHLVTRIEDDKRNAILKHDKRMKRFLRFYISWRTRVWAQAEADKSNFFVPIIKWTLLARWAKEVDALLGDDAEVVGVPTAPLDEKTSNKISLYMTWRFFSYMNATLEFIKLKFYKLLFGRAFAYCPYMRETDDGEVVYDGPGFKTLWLDDIIVPDEDVCNLQEFSFVIRRYKTTMQQLLKGERDGLYTGIKKNFQKLYQASMTSERRDSQADRMTRQRDAFEGVDRDQSDTNRETLNVWEWYGYWRLLKSSGSDAGVEDFDKRELDETPILVRYLPDTQEIIGIQSLNVLYPKMRCKRPFIEDAMVEDGSYWSPGLAEMLEDVQIELTVNHNLGTDAGEKSVSPMIGYKPANGVAPKRLKYEPGMMVPMDNPKDDLFIYSISADLRYTQLQQQNLMAIGERVSGITDMNLGRSVDRPNQPKTARQTLAYLDEGNVRLSLDNRVAREYARRMFRHLWQLDCTFADKQTFFRVTEEKAGQWFETKDGFGTITEEERFGKMDFDIRFASSTQGKEARKEQEGQLFGILMQAPIIAQNPSAQYLVLDDFLKAFGRTGMAKYMPKPAEIDYPMEAKDEWVLMAQGEDVRIHPLDNDEKHIEEHTLTLEEAKQAPPDKRDYDAEDRMIGHLLAHREQLAQKQAQAVAAEALKKSVAGLLGLGGDELPDEELGPETAPDLAEMMGGETDGGY